VDNVSQLCIPESLRSRILRLGHYPTIAGHPGGGKLYYILRQSYYWPSMSLDCYEVVKHCLACAKELINLTRRKKSVTLFPASKPLEFVAIDIFGTATKVCIRKPVHSSHLRSILETGCDSPAEENNRINSSASILQPLGFRVWRIVMSSACLYSLTDGRNERMLLTIDRQPFGSRLVYAGGIALKLQGCSSRIGADMYEGASPIKES
jgi:Integrase zinc binding domain